MTTGDASPEAPADPRAAIAALGRWCLDTWFQPEPVEKLRLFQRLFTFTFLLYLIGWTSAATEWLTVEGFHLSAEATNPAYPPPFPALPVAWLWPFLVVLFGTTLLVILDRGGRPAKALLFVLSVYVQMVDQPSSFTLNKLYVVFFFVLAVAPPSVDVVVGGRVQRLMSGWPVKIIQATIVIQYCTAGICKIAHGNWLQRSDILFTHSVGIYRTPIASVVIEYTPMWLWTVFAWSALSFELFAPLVFIPKRLRPVGIVWGSGFHLVVAALMKDLIFFSQQMMSTYVLFLPTEMAVRAERWVTRRVDRLIPWQVTGGDLAPPGGSRTEEPSGGGDAAPPSSP